MIVPDVNLLLYAYAVDSPFHEKAARWWRDCMSGTEPVGLAQVVAFGFVRLAANSKMFTRPMSVAEAAGYVREWVRQPVVQVLVPDENHPLEVFSLLEDARTGGNLVTDAQIAALAQTYDAVVHTTDPDFARFPGVRWMNPISGASGGVGARSRKA